MIRKCRDGIGFCFLWGAFKVRRTREIKGCPALPCPGDGRRGWRDFGWCGLEKHAGWKGCVPSSFLVVLVVITKDGCRVGCVWCVVCGEIPHARRRAVACSRGLLEGGWFVGLTASLVLGGRLGR